MSGRRLSLTTEDLRRARKGLDGTPAAASAALLPDAGPTATPDAGSGHGDPRWGALMAVVGVSAIAIATFVGVVFIAPETTERVTFVAPEGLTVFAVYFVAALAIERLLEPFMAIFSAKQKAADAWRRADGAVVESVRELLLAQAESADAAAARQGQAHIGVSEAERAAMTQRCDAAEAEVAEVTTERDAAEEKIAASDRRRTIGAWTVASVLGVLLACTLDLRFLALVGAQTSPAWLEYLVTGLVIGGGTAPLHDAVSWMEKKKDQKGEGTE